MDPTGSKRVFASLAAELERTRAGVDALASLVSAHVRDCPPADRPRVISQAQAVDDLSQHLDALAGYARALAAGRPVADAAASLPLAELGARLAAAEGRTVVSPPPPAAGELELFD